MIVIDRKKIIEFILLYKKEIVTIICFILFPILLFFYENKIFQKNILITDIENKLIECEKKLYDGKTFVTEHFDVMKDVTFVGDSYTHFMPLNLGFDTKVYSSPGLTINDLKYVFTSATENDSEFFVIFIGPNDFMVQNSVDSFYKTYYDRIMMLKKNKKAKIILSSYLPSYFSELCEKREKCEYKIADYDEKVKNLTREKNVYYFDIYKFYDIEKHSNVINDKSDIMHFNKDFYIDYINNLVKFILNIKLDELKDER